MSDTASWRSAIDFGPLAFHILNELEGMVAFWGDDQICRYANGAYLTWFGRTQSEMVGMRMKDLLGPLYERNKPHIDAALNGQRQEFEREIVLPNGTVRHSLATYIPHVVEGKVVGFIAHVVDVSRLKALEAELRSAKARAEELATHDFLTGLPNRVLLIEKLTQALALASRSDRMMAVVTLDLDDFKKYNDALGHSAGDRLLVEIAARCRSLMRASDTAARLGGDEFALVINDFDSIERLREILERLLSGLRKPIKLPGMLVEPGYSGGVAVYSSDGLTAQTLLENSDRALYVSKKLGKNRLSFFEPTIPISGGLEASF